MKVGVLGGGAWGTALAIHCARMGHEVMIWAREKDVVDGINGPDRENRTFLAGHQCPAGLLASQDMAQVVGFAQLVLMVIPTQFVVPTMAQVGQLFRPDHILCSCAKGIENDTLETCDQILDRVLPPHMRNRTSFLSGPSFAAEVASGKPTVVTIAARDEAVAEQVQKTLSTPYFRCYRTSDVAGVELGGALKNVLAIACGISDGLGYGANARAALITRGLAEITKVAVARGANPLTFLGLSGMGDLVLTCTGDLSRNRTVGLRIGRGERLEDILASTHTVAEGVVTARSAEALARKLGVDAPIINGIFRVLHMGEDPNKVTLEVMSRELKPEVAREVADAAAS